MASLPQVNTKHPDEVLRFLNARLYRLFPSLTFPRLQQVFLDVRDLFEGVIPTTSPSIFTTTIWNTRSRPPCV
jgi:hypothetical protein